MRGRRIVPGILTAIAAGSLLFGGCGSPARAPESDGPQSVPLSEALAETPPQLGPVEPTRCLRIGNTGMPVADSALGAPRRAADLHGLTTRVVRGESTSDAVRVTLEAGPRVVERTGDWRDTAQGRWEIEVPAHAHVVQRVGHRASAALIQACMELDVWLDRRAPRPSAEPARAAFVIIGHVFEVLPDSQPEAR